MPREILQGNLQRFTGGKGMKVDEIISYIPFQNLQIFVNFPSPWMKYFFTVPPDISRGWVLTRGSEVKLTYTCNQSTLPPLNKGYRIKIGKRH